MTKSEQIELIIKALSAYTYNDAGMKVSVWNKLQRNILTNKLNDLVNEIY